MPSPHAPWEDSAEFTIGLKPISLANWLEGGETDPAARKDALLAAAGEAVWAETAGSRPGQVEALEMVEAALGRTIDPAGRPPLLAAARQVADDLCLMEPTDGAWRLTALSLSAGSFFSAGEVIGKDLAALHGPVTGFGKRLLPRVVRVFHGLREGLLLERRNWSLVNSGALHAPDPLPLRARIGAIPPAAAGSELFLRVERQTLRRLPRTGGALFTIRVWLTPLAELAAEPQRLHRFADAWGRAHPDFRAYKRLELYDDLVAGFLAAHLPGDT